MVSVEPIPDPPLAGRLALVTGGGSGIGLACARALLADGADVALAARNTERLDTAAAELRTEFPSATVLTVGCDVTDESSVETAVAAAADAGPLRIVVANAGAGSAGPFHLTSLDDWNSVLATNLTGAFLTLKHAVPHLAGHGGGAIVGISSIAATATHRYMTPYNVSKAGLEMLIRQVADELGSSGIRANAVRPSLVPTDISAGLTAVPEIVEDGTGGLLVPPSDPGALADAVVRVLLSPGRGGAMGRAGYERVRRDFTFERQNALLEGIYAEILAVEGR